MLSVPKCCFWKQIVHHGHLSEMGFRDVRSKVDYLVMFVTPLMCYAGRFIFYRTTGIQLFSSSVHQSFQSASEGNNRLPDIHFWLMCIKVLKISHKKSFVWSLQVNRVIDVFFCLFFLIFFFIGAVKWMFIKANEMSSKYALICIINETKM